MKKIIIVVLTALFSLQTHAQDPDLFEHTWHFHIGNLDGEDFEVPNSELASELDMSLEDNYFTITHPNCGEIEQLSDEISFETDANIFNLGDYPFVLEGTCNTMEFDFIPKLYAIFYEDVYEAETANNPFTYTLEIENDIQFLTIENTDGDYAVYSNKELSVSSFEATTVSVYPNPVEETLYVETDLQQPFSLQLMDPSGAVVKRVAVSGTDAAIPVASLASGLYFLVLENSAGHKVVRRFIKQ